LTQKIEREHLMQQLPDLSSLILEVVKEHGRATISDIQSITKANRNTIKVRLRELVIDGYLIKQGRGKGTWYTLGRRLPGLVNSSRLAMQNDVKKPRS